MKTSDFEIEKSEFQMENSENDLERSKASLEKSSIVWKTLNQTCKIYYYV